MTLHPSYSICGCDVSYWQASIDYAKLTAKGVCFVIARTSNGTTLDSRYSQHVAGAVAAGLPYGAYHYQAFYRTARQNAATMIKAQPTLPQMRCWLDIEAQTSLLLYQSSEHIYATLMLLDEHYQTLTGIYCNQEAWRRLVSPIYYDRLDLYNRPLWVANYFYDFAASPNLPASWHDWDLWQFSGSVGPYAGKASQFGVTGSKSLDINAFNGGEATFAMFIGEEVQPPEPPEPEPEVSMKIKVKANGTNIRNAPVIAKATDIGDMPAGVVLDTIGESGDFWKVQAFVAKSVVTVLSDPPTQPLPPPAVAEYEVHPDWEYGATYRDQRPMVYHFDQDAPTLLTKAWQEFIFALNPGMDKKGFRALLRWNTAFTNWTGFDDPDGSLRADWINGLDLGANPPLTDKCRCCPMILHGVENGGILTVETLDGSKPPPPLADVKPWHKFKCVTINGSEAYNFPQNHGDPVWFPLVATGIVTVKLGVKALDKPYPYVTRVK